MDPNLFYVDMDRGGEVLVAIIVLARRRRTTGSKPEYKLEEDIVPPFTSKFSHSTSTEAKELPELRTLSAAAKLFPGLEKLDVGAASLEIVNGLEVHEVARWIGQFSFERTTVVKACLSFWHRRNPARERPSSWSFRTTTTWRSGQRRDES